MEIQIYSEARASEIADLFYQAVHAIDQSVYTSEQQEAWAPTPVDYVHWSERLSVKRPFLAIIEGRVAGFIELDTDGHIDCIYVHPDFQGKGVASTLYKRLFADAVSRKLKRLYVEASLIAKPFFEHFGFVLIKKNEIKRNGVSLVNFSMEKYLSPNNRMESTANALAD